MYEIRISEQVLESMALASIEAYCLGDGRKNLKELETYGYIWGYKKFEDNDLLFYIDRFSISISAIRTNGYVQPHKNSATLKNDVVKRFSPHSAMLGSFHSHPYKNLQEVNSCSGFEFSDGDFEFFRASDELWEYSGGTPVFFAMTVCRLKRVRTTSGGKWVRYNIWYFDLGHYRFWLNVSVGFINELGERDLTKNTHSNAVLNLNSRLFNQSGDRIQGG